MEALWGGKASERVFWGPYGVGLFLVATRTLNLVSHHILT